MSEEVTAVCSKCGNATTGKIYEPYWCADCKIKSLGEDVQFYKEQYQYAENERSKWVKMYNDESSQKVKYRNAFECLYEKISLKNN